MPPSAQEEEYNPSHLPPEDRLRRETGKAQVGGGAHAGMARPLPQAVDTLREAGRHSRSLPPSGLLAHLPQLPLVRVLQCTLNREKWDREDYRRHTISRAIAGTTNFYSPRPGGRSPSRNGQPPDPEASGL